MIETHYDVIREISNEGWNFKQTFIRALIYPKPEKKDKSPLAYAFGAEVEKTGKYFCPLCDSYLTSTTCSEFESFVRDSLKGEVIIPHMEKHCPECETKIDNYEMVEVVDDEIEFKLESDVDPKPQKITSQEKTRYNPCGCLFEIGEEEFLWDLDKEKVEEEVSVLRYDGSVFERGYSDE